MLKIKKNEKLKKALDDRGMKDKFAAKQAGMDTAYFSRIKNGRMIPTSEQMSSIADVFGLSADDLF